MASKDQAIGGVICLVCVLVAVFYVAALFFYTPITDALPWLYVGEPGVVQFWLIAVPVLVAFVAILAIGAWIGWTMATTPPPKPIEEITTEIEETKTEAPEPSAEEKKPEKKKKS